MLPSWCDDTIAVSRAPLVKSRGSDTRDWDQATTHTVTGCSVQPGNNNFNLTEARIAITYEMVAYCPPDADIQAEDHITYEGRTYVLNGGPRVWRSPSGMQDHMVLNLDAWEG